MKQLAILKVTAIFLFLAMGVAINAQDKSEFKDKIGQLNGKIDKVTVSVEGKEVIFEGKDAEKLVKIVKPMAGKKMIWLDSEGEDFEFEGPGNAMMFHVSEDIDKAKGEQKKKIQIEIKEGKKQVTVTTTDKDGKEEVKKYEGEEADKFIKEHEAVAGKAHKKVRIIKEDDGEEDCDVFMFNQKISPRHGVCGRCCCGGGMKMMHMPSPGKHKIMMKMMDGDEDVIIKKKIQKKQEMKTEQKEEKK